MKRAAFLLFVFAGGCTTAGDADSLLASRYNGSNTDAFFTKFGPPASSYSLNNGDTLYTWQERARYWTSSGSITTTVIGNVAVSNVDPGATHLQQCQLKITAGQDGRIKSISVLSDSLGRWQMSRCNEYFSSR